MCCAVAATRSALKTLGRRIKMHQEKDRKRKEDDVIPKGAVPSYLLDRQTSLLPRRRRRAVAAAAAAAAVCVLLLLCVCARGVYVRVCTCSRDSTTGT